MSQVFNLYKPVGATPLELLNQFRKSEPRYADSKLTYVGRLDPLAHGVQLLMSDPTRTAVEALKGLDKTYRVELVLGLATDSYDLLGLITEVSAKKINLDVSLAKQKFSEMVGEFQQSYPPYSAAKVDGKSLFDHAKSGTLDTIEIPKKQVTVHSVSNIEIGSINKDELIAQAIKRIELVSGDFRQEQIKQTWSETDMKLPESSPRISFEIACSSGTYIRSICDQLGRQLGTYGLCFDLLRTEVGDYHLADCVRLDEA